VQLEGVGVVMSVSMLVLLGGLGHDGGRDGVDDEQRGGLGLRRNGRRGEVDEERRGGLGHDRGRRGAVGIVEGARHVRLAPSSGNSSSKLSGSATEGLMTTGMSGAAGLGMTRRAR